MKIMRARGVPAESSQVLPGTRFLTPRKRCALREEGGLETLYARPVADAFNVANKVYAKPQPIGDYIDASLSREALGK